MRPIYEEINAHSGVFTLVDEDHTLGNAIRSVLLQNPNVQFAGYRIPHPLENKMTITITTNESITPIDAYNDALDYLMRECDSLSNM